MSAVLVTALAFLTLLAPSDATWIPNDVATRFGIPVMMAEAHEAQVRSIAVQPGMGIRHLRMASCGTSDWVKINQLTISPSVDIDIKKQFPFSVGTIREVNCEAASTDAAGLPASRYHPLLHDQRNYFAKVTMKQDNKVIACQTVSAAVQV
ncbi:hypothetical protein RvY_00635 [Ramazzottius varieornatus]|uniref:MD-2-related lipid-recognition domain-containing protein n=1 Tax=Ramazzottius varieornatus TaxID=947166 RepID=A0A1D1UDG7_RAMVA|nr:hypothetical protein RvY_00635 [Ramazzottius varieornatus]